MTTQTANTTTAPRETPMGELRQPSTGWKTTRQYAGLVLIIIWGLAPFYWMIVTAFRDVGFTYDTTPWPTHVTMENFKTAFSTIARQSLRAGAGQQRHHRRADHRGCHAGRGFHGLRPRPAGVPGQVPRVGLHPRRLDVPRGRPGVTPVLTVLLIRLAERLQLPGLDHPGHLLRAPAHRLYADGLLLRDAVGAGRVGAD